MRITEPAELFQIPRFPSLRLKKKDGMLILGRESGQPVMEAPLSPEELKTEVLRLAPEFRATLAHALLESLEDLPEAEIETL